MDQNSLELLAAKNAALPPALTPPEQLLFLSLRSLYAAYRAKAVPRRQAQREKERLLRDARRYQGIYDSQHRAWQQFAATNTATEPARLRYARARAAGADPQTLLPLACEIIRIATGDRTF